MHANDNEHNDSCNTHLIAELFPSGSVALMLPTSVGTAAFSITWRVSVEPLLNTGAKRFVGTTVTLRGTRRRGHRGGVQ